MPSGMSFRKPTRPRPASASAWRRHQQSSKPRPSSAPTPLKGSNSGAALCSINSTPSISHRIAVACYDPSLDLKIEGKSFGRLSAASYQTISYQSYSGKSSLNSSKMVFRVSSRENISNHNSYSRKLIEPEKSTEFRKHSTDFNLIPRTRPFRSRRQIVSRPIRPRISTESVHNPSRSHLVYEKHQELNKCAESESITDSDEDILFKTCDEHLTCNNCPPFEFDHENGSKLTYQLDDCHDKIETALHDKERCSSTSNLGMLKVETVSNDGSETSQCSLGSKIQQIARLQRPLQCPALQAREAGNYECTLKNSSDIDNLSNTEESGNIKPGFNGTSDFLEFENNDWESMLRKNNELLASLSASIRPFPKEISDNEDPNDKNNLSSDEEINDSENDQLVVIGTQNRSQSTTISQKSNNLYFTKSSKPLIPILPSTLDCLLEDIIEESSESDSFASHCNSTVRDGTNKSEIKTENNDRKRDCDKNAKFVSCTDANGKFEAQCSDHDDNGIGNEPLSIVQPSCESKKEVEQCRKQNQDIDKADTFPDIICDTKSNNDGICARELESMVRSDFSRSAVDSNRNFKLDCDSDIPSRMDFVEQKLAITKMLEEKRERRLLRSSSTIQPMSCCSRCSHVLTTSICAQKCDKCCNQISPELSDGALTSDEPSANSADQLTEENDTTRPPCIEEKLADITDAIEEANHILLSKWGASAPSEGGELGEKLLQALDRLLRLCLRAGVTPEATSYPELHDECRRDCSKKQADLENRLQKNLDLTRKLLDDKKQLADSCAQKVRQLNEAKEAHLRKVRVLQERHEQELQESKQRLLIAEQTKREKWAVQKTKAIKESSFRGLETRIRTLVCRHRDEISQLKEEHWKALKASEESGVQQLRQQEQQLKTRYEQEREEVMRQEREREQKRQELQLQQCSQAAREQAQAAEQRHQATVQRLVEEHQRLLTQCNRDHEAEKERLVTSAELTRRGLVQQLGDQADRHKADLRRVAEEHEASVRRAREEVRLQAQTETAQQLQTLTERLKRQRDRDVDRVLRAVQAQTEEDQKKVLQQADRRFQSRLAAIEQEAEAARRGEALLRTRLIEARAEAAQLQEQVACLRARLQQQHRELCLLQQMAQQTDESTEDSDR